MSTSSAPMAAAGATRATFPLESAANEYGARNEEEIAAHFPVLSDAIADRLVDLLLPSMRSRRKREQVA